MATFLYCDSISCRSFTLLKIIAKNIAIVSRAIKKRIKELKTNMNKNHFTGSDTEKSNFAITILKKKQTDSSIFVAPNLGLPIIFFAS